MPQTGAHQLPPGYTPLDLAPPDVPGELRIGDSPQLFCDDFLLTRGSAGADDYPTGFRFAPAPVEKDTEPVMLPGRDAPWERHGMHWVSVLYDSGRFRCWYNIPAPSERPRVHPNQRMMGGSDALGETLVAYAESDDGLTWRKPKLGLVELYGSTENNLSFEGDLDREAGLGAVFVDPTASTGERYRMLYRSHWGIGFAYSPDGLSWTRGKRTTTLHGMDTQNNAHFDVTLERYVGYVRFNPVGRGGREHGVAVAPERRGRSVARMESEDIDWWSPPTVVIAPDHDDGLDMDIYTCPHIPHRDLHLMLLSAYHHRSGKLDLQVAASRDNISWTRPTRTPLVTNGDPGDYDEYRLYASPGPFLPAGDGRMAIYTRTGQGPHGGAVDATYEPGAWADRDLGPGQERQDGAMGRVVLGRDRIVGIESDPDTEATFATRDIVFDGQELTVNVQPTGPEAVLRVQVVVGREGKTLGGLDFDACSPVTEDGLDQPVRWSGAATVGAHAGSPVRLQFRMRSMRLYGFRFGSSA